MAGRTSAGRMVRGAMRVRGWPARRACLGRGLSMGLGLALGFFATGVPQSARAQVAAWPEKPLTMIVPFPPGGVADTVARPVADDFATRRMPAPYITGL